MKIGDLMQKFFMSNPKRAMWFMSTMPASFWEKQGRKKVLSTFHETAEKVSAYKKILAENNVDHEEIKTFEDFQKKVPIIDKDNYVKKYKLKDRCLGELPEMGTVSMSSGSSGTPSFWPRLARQDQMLPKYFENFYLQNWNIDKKSTLFVVTMALGAWIAGQLVSGATKAIADSGKYPLTLITPGADVEQITRLLKELGKEYDQIIITVYPSLLVPILDAGEKKNIDWKRLNIKLWIGGEPVSGKWLKRVRSRLNADPKDISFVANVYGTSDAGGIGFSTPLSSLITNLSSKNKQLAKSLFDSENLPSLIQYSPMGYFIEEANGKIIINYMSGVPLIRYRICDSGGVISFKKIKETLKKHGYDVGEMLLKKGYEKNTTWKWPFLYVFGRSDNTVSIGGANVYPENVESALYQKETEMINSFKLTIKTSKKGAMQLVILVELKKDAKISLEKMVDLERKYHDIFLDKLLETNDDFRDAHEIDPKSTDPLIEIYTYGQGPFAKDKKRTKPRIIV